MFLKKYYQEIILGVIVILLLGLFVIIYYFHYVKEDPVSNASFVETIAEEIPVEEEDGANKLFVEIKGAVVTPGVYEATSKTIINDIVNLAGGFTNEAYTKNINLSKVISNEMVIYVYTQWEYNRLNEPTVVYVEKECECPTYDISACINSGNSVIENGEGDGSVETESSSLININTASLEELMTLSGIGESKAQSIIDYRTQNGNFTKIEDITLVSGISEATFEKFKDKITV